MNRSSAPLQRPCVAALAMCVEQVSFGKGNERHGKGEPFARQKWVRLAREHGIGFLTGQAEKKWIEANESIIATDDERYVREVTGAMVYSLMALIWLVPMRCGASMLVATQHKMSSRAWLVGAWPLQQPLAAPKTLLWPAPNLMSEPELITSLQNAVLHMAQVLCKRLDAMRLVPPPLMEFGCAD